MLLAGQYVCESCGCCWQVNALGLWMLLAGQYLGGDVDAAGKSIPRQSFGYCWQVNTLVEIVDAASRSMPWPLGVM